MLIGAYGDSRAGKDKTAGFLVQDFGFTQRNMADRIRALMLGSNLYLPGPDGEVVLLDDIYEKYNGNWDDIKKYYPESVEIMIGLGQRAREVLGEGIWVDAVLKDRPDKLVIADVRQPNEYQKIKELGGEIWKITKPGTKPRGMDRLLEGYQFDVIIDNRGTLLDLRSQVQAVMGRS